MDAAQAIVLGIVQGLTRIALGAIVLALAGAGAIS
jgi:hypothetical protein